MWAGGTDPLYRAALCAPHVAYIRCDVVSRAGVTLIADLPIVGGNVNVNLGNRVVRSCSFQTYADYFPFNPDGSINYGGSLTPYGNRVQIWRGITYGDGTVARFPVFFGRMDEVELDQTGLVSVTASDLAADVIDFDFELPESSSTGSSLSAQIQTLILEALPDATFGTFSQVNSTTPALTWASGRGQALDDLAAVVGSTWYALADGSFVLRRNPWTAPGKTAVAVITDAGGAFPMITQGRVTLSRAGVSNSVVYTSERSDGTPPVTAIARNLTASSPSYFLGNFGKVPVHLTNQAAYTMGQTQAAANQQLAQLSSVSSSWSVSIVPDASIELGDLLGIDMLGVNDQQVVTGFTIPLSVQTDMSLTLHSYVPTTEAASS